MKNRNWKHILAYLGWQMDAGLPLGNQRLEPTTAAELGLVVGRLPQMTLHIDDEPELETVPEPADVAQAASGCSVFVTRHRRTGSGRQVACVR
ncbi:hypothetical protein NN561_000698 [Cricetulus griseus]